MNLDSFVSHFSSVELTNQKPLTAALRAFLRGLANSQAAVAKPSGLHSAICKRAPRFKGFQQQDAQELYLVLLDALEQEEKGVPEKPAHNEGDSDEEEDAGDGDDDGDGGPDASQEPPSAPEPGAVAPTFVEAHFGGQTVSRVTCGTCGTVTSCTEPFQDVSLPLPSTLSAAPTGGSRSFGAAPKAAASARVAAAKVAQPVEDADEVGGKADSSVAADKRLSGKDRKRMEKEARRNAKRNRMGAKASKYKSPAAKSAGEAALARAAARGDAQSAEQSGVADELAGGGSSSDSDDGAPAGEDNAQPVDGDSAAPPASGEPERDACEVAEAAASVPQVILLGPPPGADALPELVAVTEHDWLDFVDTEAAAAQGQRGVVESESDDDEHSVAHSSSPDANGGPPAAGSAADGDTCCVLACLRAYCAEEQLTGDARYACEACAKVAAAERGDDGGVIRVRRRKKSAKGGGSRSVRWAPDDQLEDVLLIPSVGKGLSLRNPTTFEHDCHGESGTGDQDGEVLPGSETGEEESQPAADLLQRFASVAVTVADDSEEAAAPEPPPVEVQDEPVAEEVEEPSSPVAEGTPDGGCGEDDRYEWVELPAPPPPRSILRDAVKSVRFSALSPVLVLTLKRFRQDVRGRTRKLSGHVSFEEELDVGALCDGSLQHSYQLRGVVEHSGGLSGGHYVAYVRRAGDQQWYYISDRHVRPVTAATVFDAEAYLLFYERV